MDPGRVPGGDGTGKEVAMKIRYALALFAAMLLALPTGLDSCSIAPPEPLFSTTRRPADIRNEFVKGKIGVIQPSFELRFLIGAYRLLSGGTFSEEEIEQIYAGAQPSPAVFSPARSALGSWTTARSRVTGVKPVSIWNVYRTQNSNGAFSSYQNCLDSAFHMAARTLEQRADKWGSDSPKLRDWVQAQDQVFANCSGKEPVIPNEPDPAMDPLLAADRRYQIAAAYFYSAQWQKAREAFERIAADNASPWRSIAPYLLARAFIREGMVDGKPDALREAEGRLNAIASDPARKEWHDASLRLLDYVRIRIDPATRIKELEARILHPSAGATLGDDLADYTYLYRRIAGEKPGHIGDLTDWLLAIERRTEDAGSHAVTQWRETHSPAWLIAALMNVGQDESGDLITDARQTPPGAPAYESLTYYGIARQIATGHRDDAREWADEALKHKLLLSTRNRILSQRLTLARNWTEFLRYAPRTPEPQLVNYDGYEVELKDAAPGEKAGPMFDQDATALFNRRIPLSLWLDAAGNSLLPRHLQLQIAQAGWVRAVLLERHADGGKFMQRMIELQPRWADAARDYLTAKDADAARFAAAFLLLRMPAVSAGVGAGRSQISELSKPNRSGAVRWGASGSEGERLLPAAEFLTPAQRQQGEEEQKQIGAVSCGATYLAAEVLRWARAHREDARVPEALYLVVQATRRGCRTERTGEYSRQAFVLLKQRYAGSEWAQKTKYWYP
jgi:hypothetical protein